jgi:hypothetical protein
MTSPLDLVEFWRRLPPDRYVHPDDLATLASTKHRLVLEQLPVPWYGSLQTARVFVLLLNPGHDAATAPSLDSEMIALRRRRLAGEGVEADVIALHRKNKTGFEKWFGGKLRGVSKVDALTTDLCVLNLVAYCSPAFQDHRLIGLLPSTQLVRRIVQEDLAPRARAGEVMLLVVRQAARWGFTKDDQTPTLRVFDPKTEARGAHMTIKTTHGHHLDAFLRGAT